MAQPPVTDGEFICSMCGNKGMIYRPETDTEHFIVLREYDAAGALVDVEHLVQTRHGGIDACPACAACVEATYQLRNHQQQVEDRTCVRLKVVK